MAGTASIERDLLNFVGTYVARSQAVDSQTDLVTSGILDSMLIVDLIAHIERTHGVSFESGDITPAVFQNVASLSAVIADRLRHKQAA